MALCEMNLWSNSLQMQTSAMMIIPQGIPGPWTVLYLLHGMSDNHTSWTRRTSIERYVDNLPLMVVMPSVGRGWYTDSATQPNARYESLITEDLVQFVDATFPTNATRDGRVLAGLSMGGYGAFKIALHRPDLFSAAVSHSGAVHFGSRSLSEDTEGRMREFTPLFGENPVGGPNDIYALAKNIGRSQLPALRLDCGTEDFLIEQNRDLHREWEKSGIPHEYAEHPGGHEWAYWDEHIQDSLGFFKRIGRIKTPQPSS